jgi:hypothetical protein
MQSFFAPHTSSRSASPTFPIVQHNCLGSWNVFLALFHSFSELKSPPLIVAIQDPPTRSFSLPSFPGFSSFSPPSVSAAPRVAIYISNLLNSWAECAMVYYDSPDIMSVDVTSPTGLFRSSHKTIRVTNAYLLRTASPPYRSVPPHLLFPKCPVPTLVVGDFNIHHVLLDPSRAHNSAERRIADPYIDLALEEGFSVLNTPGVYTRFPFDLTSRPSVIDMSFASASLAPFFSSWDTPLPSTGSDHVPILLQLEAPDFQLPPPRLHWDLLDWEKAHGGIANLQNRPPPLPGYSQLSLPMV